MLAAAAASFVASALVAWWLMAAEGADTKPAPVRVRVEEAEPGLLGESPPGGLRPTKRLDDVSEPAGKGPRIRVHAQSAESGAALAGARIALVDASGDLGHLAFTARSAVAATEETDELGNAVMEVPSAQSGGAESARWRLCAAMKGYSCAHVSLPAAGALCTMSLQPGLRIRGTVVTAGGDPVAGVDVVGRYDRTPASAIEWERAEFENRVVMTKSDELGRFELSGLASGTYWVSVYGDGWMSRGAAQPGRLRYLGERVEAGTQDCRQVVVPYRCVRFQLMCGDGKPAPVDSLQLGFLGGRLSPGVVSGSTFMEVRRALVRGQWVRIQGATGGPGMFTACVTLTRDATPESVRVNINARGGDGPVLSELALMLPSELRSTQRVDRVEVAKSGRTGGRVHAICKYYRARIVRGPPPRLRLISFGGGRRFVVGRPAAEDGAWAFENVPVGAWQAAVVDMNAETNSVHVDVRAGETQEVHLAFREPSGITLALSDAKGVRLFNPNIVSLRSRSGKTIYPMPSFDPAPGALGSDGTTLLGLLIPLRPGVYELTVYRHGFEKVTIPGITVPVESCVQEIKIAMSRVKTSEK